MAQDPARLHAAEGAAHEMEIGAADGGSGQAHDRIRVGADLRLGFKIGAGLKIFTAPDCDPAGATGTSASVPTIIANHGATVIYVQQSTSSGESETLAALAVMRVTPSSWKETVEPVTVSVSDVPAGSGPLS